MAEAQETGLTTVAVVERRPSRLAWFAFGAAVAGLAGVLGYLLG